MALRRLRLAFLAASLAFLLAPGAAADRITASAGVTLVVSDGEGPGQTCLYAVLTHSVPVSDLDSDPIDLLCWSDGTLTSLLPDDATVPLVTTASQEYPGLFAPADHGVPGTTLGDVTVGDVTLTFEACDHPYDATYRYVTIRYSVGPTLAFGSGLPEGQSGTLVQCLPVGLADS